MSTTIRPHPKPHSISPDHFNARGKTHNTPSFVVQIHLRFHFLGFPFSSHIFNFPVNLLHFTSKLFTTHHKAYLPSPPSKLFLYNPTVIYPPSPFLIVGLQTCFTSLSSLISHFNSSFICADWSPSSWSSGSLSVPLSSLVSLQALLQWLYLVCQPVKLLRYGTSCW